MKYLSLESSVDSSAQGIPPQDRADEAAPAIEEYAGVDVFRATRRTDRWLGLAIALATAVIGFGFAGRTWTPQGAGSTSVALPTPASIGQIAPPSRAPIAVLTSPEQAGAERVEGEVPTLLQLSSITLAGSISVSLRPSAVSDPSGADAVLLIDGHAPSTVSSVTIDVRSPFGSLLASAAVPNVVGDERPASDGGPWAGVGRLHRHMVVPGPIPADGWQVEISWREGSTGALGSATQRLVAIRP